MCDSFAAVPSRNRYGRNMIAKIDDRQMGEAETLVFVPAADHEPGSTVKCTLISIPQVAHTYAHIGSKIWWMYGYEMAINEKGVTIVYNAEHSVFPVDPKPGLVGGDLCRLAIERGATAYETMHVICDLVEEYGQEGNNHLLDFCRYEEGFLISDSKEIWRLETAGHKWIARRVTGSEALTNHYNIQTEYDEIADGLIEYAIENKLTDPAKPFNFAQSFNMPAIWYMRAMVRGNRVQEMLDEIGPDLDVSYARKIFSDHYEGTMLRPRFGVGTAIVPAVCMHAHVPGNAKNDASIITVYDDDFGPVTWSCYSTCCTSAFLPVYFTGYLPERLSYAAGKYERKSLWWTMEWLGIVTEMEYNTFIGRVRSVLNGVQSRIDEDTRVSEAKARELMHAGKKEEAFAILNSLMDRSAETLYEAAAPLADELYGEVKKAGGPFGPRNRGLVSIWERDEMPL